jgi:hypothetical protein
VIDAVVCAKSNNRIMPFCCLLLLLLIQLIGKRNEGWKLRYSDTFRWFQTHCNKYLSRSRAVVIFAHAINARPIYRLMQRRLHRAGIPSLVLHGNGHTFFHSVGPGKILRVQVDRGGDAPPVKVTITGIDGTTNFSDENNKITFADTFIIDRRKG